MMRWIKISKENKYIKKIRYSRIYGKCWNFYTYIRWLYCFCKNTYFKKLNYVYINVRIIYIYIKILYKIIIIKFSCFFNLIINFDWVDFFIFYKNKLIYFYRTYVLWFIFYRLYKYIYGILKWIIVLYTWPYVLAVHIHIWIFSKIYFYLFKHSISETRLFKYFKYHNSLLLKQIIALPVILYIYIYNYRNWFVSIFYMLNVIINTFFIFINNCFSSIRLYWYRHNILYKIFLKSKFLFCFFYDYGECKRFLKRFFFVKYFFAPILVVYLYIIAYIWNPFQVIYFLFKSKCYDIIRYIRYKYVRKWFFIKFEVIDLWLDFLIKYSYIILKFFDYIINNLFNIVLKCSDIYYDKEIFSTYVHIRDKRWMHGISPEILDMVLKTNYDKIILKAKYRYYIDSWLVSKTFFKLDYDELFCSNYIYQVQSILSFISADIKFMFKVYNWFCKGKVDFFFFKLVYMMIYHKVYDKYNSEINLFNIVKNEKFFFYWLECQKRKYWNDNFVKLIYDSNVFKKVFNKINYYIYMLFFIFPLKLLVNKGFIDPFIIFKIGYFFTDAKRKFRSINLYYVTYIKILLYEFYFFRKFFIFIKWFLLWKKRFFIKAHRNYYFNKRINEIKFNFLLFSESYDNLGFFSFINFVFRHIINYDNLFIRLTYFLFKYIVLYIGICIILFFTIFYLNLCLGVSLYIPELFFDLFFLSKLSFLHLIYSIYDVCIYFIQSLHVENWRPSLWYFYDPIAFFGFGEFFNKFINFEYFSMLCTSYIYDIYRYIGIYILYPLIFIIDYFMVFFLKFLINFVWLYNLLGSYSGGILIKFNEIWLNILLDYKVYLNNNWFIILSNYENDLNWQIFDQFIFYVNYKSNKVWKPCLLILYERNHELLNTYSVMGVLILIIDNLVNFLFKLVIFNIDLFSYLIFYIFPTIVYSTLCNIVNVNNYYYLMSSDNLLIIKLCIIDLFNIDKLCYINIISLLNELSFVLAIILNWFFIFMIDLPIGSVNLLDVTEYNKFIIYYINILIGLYEVFIYFFNLSNLIINFVIDLVCFFYKFFLVIIFNGFENDIWDILLLDNFIIYNSKLCSSIFVKCYVYKLYLLFIYVDGLVDYILISIILELYIWFVMIPYCFVMYLYHTFMMYFYMFVIFLIKPYVAFMLHLIDLFFIYFSMFKYLFTMDLLYWYRDFMYRLYLYAYNIIYIMPVIVWISLIIRFIYSILFIIKGIILYITYCFFKSILLFMFYMLKYFVYVLSVVFFYVDISNIIELSNLNFNFSYLLFIELIDFVGVIIINIYMYIIDIIFFVLFDLDCSTDVLFDYITYVYIRLYCYNYWNRIIDAIFNINIYNSMIYYYLVLHYFWLIRISWRRLEKIMFPERFIIKIGDDELSIEALWNKYKYEIVGKNKKALFLSFNEYCFFYTIDLVKYLSEHSDHPLYKRLSKEAFYLNEFSFSVSPYAEIERNDELNFVQIWLRRLIGKVFVFRWMIRDKLNSFLINYLVFKGLNCNYPVFKKNIKYIINYYYNSYRFFKFYIKRRNFNIFKDIFNIKHYVNIIFIKKDKLLDNIFDLIDFRIDKFVVFYKNFYWEYIFNFDLKLNAILYKYNRFVYCFKQNYLCISYKTKYKGKDFYKKEDFISYTVQLEQSILNRGILVGSVYKYKLVKNKLLRKLNRNLFNNGNLVDFNEVYINEAKLKFLCGYETNDTFWNEELGKSIIEVYSQYNKYIMDIIQFPVMPDLTGFAVYLTDNEVLLSFEKSSLRRNSHFNEFFKELEKGTTKLSIFKNTRFLFKDFDRMGIYSVTNIPHLNALSFEGNNDEISDEAVLFAKEISNKLVSLSVSYKNYLLDNANIVDDISPINMSDRYQVGLVGDLILSQVEDQYSRYLNGTIFYDPWVKYIKWKDAVLESKKLRPYDINMVKYFNNIGFDKFTFSIFSKHTGKEFIMSIMSGVPMYYTYISYYFNTFIYEFFSLFRLFRFDLIVEFFDDFFKLANFTFNHRLHLKGLVERDFISMHSFGKEVFKFMNNSFLELEKQYKSSLFFNRSKERKKIFGVSSNFSFDSYNDNNWLFLFYNSSNSECDFLKVDREFKKKNFLFNYTYINFVKDYSVIDDRYDNVNFNKKILIENLGKTIKIYLDKEEILSLLFILNSRYEYLFNNWLISSLDDNIFLKYWYYSSSDSDFDNSFCFINNRFLEDFLKKNLYYYNNNFYLNKLYFNQEFFKKDYGYFLRNINYLNYYSSNNVYSGNKLVLFFNNCIKAIECYNTDGYCKSLSNYLFYNNNVIWHKFYYFEVIKQLKFILNKHLINNYIDIITIFNNFSLLREYAVSYNLSFLSFFYVNNELISMKNLFLLLKLIYCRYNNININFVYDIFCISNNKLKLEYKLYLFDNNWNFMNFFNKKNVLMYIRNNIYNNCLLGNSINNYNDISNFDIGFYNSDITSSINIDIVRLLNYNSNNNLIKLLSDNSNTCINNDLNDKECVNKNNFYLNLLFNSNNAFFFNKIDFFNLKTYFNFPSLVMWYSSSNFFSKYILFDNNSLDCLVDNNEVVITTANCNTVYSNYSSKLYFLVNSIQKFTNFNFSSSVFLYKLISIEDLFILMNMNINNKQICFFTLENFNFYVSLIMDFFMNSKIINLLYNRLFYEVMHEVYYNLYRNVVDINSIFNMYLQYFNIFTEINVILSNKLMYYDINDKDINLIKLSSHIYNDMIVYDKLYLDFLKESWSYDIFELFKVNLVKLNNILIKHYSKFNLSLDDNDVFNYTLNDEFNYKRLYSDIDFIRYVDINKLFPTNISSNDNSSTVESNLVNVILPIIDFKIETLMSSTNFFSKRLGLMRLSIGNKELDDDLFYLIIGRYLNRNKLFCIEIERSKLFDLISFLNKYSNIKYFGNGNIWYWPDYLKYLVTVIDEFELYFNTLIYSSKLGFKGISNVDIEKSSKMLSSIYFFFGQFCKEIRYFAFNKEKGCFLDGVYNYCKSNSEFIEEFYYHYIILYIRINELLINYSLFNKIEAGLLVYDKTKNLADDYSLIGKICDTHSLLLGLMNFKLHMMKEFISFRYSLSLLLIDCPKFYFFFDIKEFELLKNINYGSEGLRIAFFKNNNIDKFDYKINLIKLIKSLEFYSGKLNFRFFKNEFLSLFDSLLDGDKYEDFIFNYSYKLDWDKRKSFFYFYTKYVNGFMDFSTNFVLNINTSFIDYFKYCLLKDFTATVRVSGYTGININPFMISKLYRGFKSIGLYEYISSDINIYSRVFFNYLPVTSWDLHKFIMCEENCNFLQFLMVKEFNVMFLYQLGNFESISCRLSIYLNRFIQNIELYRISLLKDPEILALYFNKNYKCINNDKEKEFFESFNRNIFFINSLENFLENLSLTIDKNCFKSNNNKSFKIDEKVRFITSSIEVLYLNLIKDKKRSGYTSFLETSLTLRNFGERFKFLKQLLLQIKVSASLLSDKDCIDFFYSLWYNYADFLNHKINFEWLNRYCTKNNSGNVSSFLFITAGPNINENDMFFFSKYFSEKDGELARRLISETQCYIDYRILKHLSLNNRNDFFIKLFDEYIFSSNKEIYTFLFPVHGFKFFDYYIGKPEFNFLGIYSKFYSSWTLENYRYFFDSRINVSVVNSISYLFIQMGNNNNYVDNIGFFTSTINRVFGFMSKLIEIQHKSIRGILLDELRLNVMDKDNLCITNFSREKLINLVLLNNYFHKEFFNAINVSIHVIKYKLVNDELLHNSLSSEILFDLNASIKKIKKLLLDSDEMLAVLRSCIRFYCYKNNISYDILDVYFSRKDRFLLENDICNYIIDDNKNIGNIFRLSLSNSNYIDWYNEDMEMRRRKS